jgi:hypothetical protein
MQDNFQFNLFTKVNHVQLVIMVKHCQQCLTKVNHSLTWSTIVNTGSKIVDHGHAWSIKVSH